MIKYSYRLFISAFSLRILSFFFQATLPLILVYFNISTPRSYWFFIFILWLFGAMGSLYSVLLTSRKVLIVTILVSAIMAIALASSIKYIMLISVYVIFMIVSALSVGTGSSSYVEGYEHRGVSIYSAGLAFGLSVAILAQLVFLNLKNLYIITIMVLALIALTAMFYPFNGRNSSEKWSVDKVKEQLLLSIKSVNVINVVAGSMAWPFAVTFLGVYAYKFLNFSLTMVSMAFLISVLISAVTRLALYRVHKVPGGLVQRISVIIYGISLLGVIFKEPAVFLLLMSILGVAHGLYTPTVLYKFLSDSNEKLMGYLTYNASMGAGEVLSSIIGGFMISELNYVYGILAFSLFFLILNIAIFSIEMKNNIGNF